MLSMFNEKVTFIWSVAELLRGPYRRLLRQVLYSVSKFIDSILTTIEQRQIGVALPCGSCKKNSDSEYVTKIEG
jgi:hypothetical protein